MKSAFIFALVELARCGTFSGLDVVTKLLTVGMSGKIEELTYFY